MPNTGIESATLRSLVQRSNQLSYAAADYAAADYAAAELRRRLRLGIITQLPK